MRPDDLIRLGDLLFRYQRATAESPRELRIYSLGEFEVYYGGVSCAGSDWKSQKLRFLLAFVMAEWPRPVSVEVLLEQFWPESDLAKARNSLRVALSRLRRLLDLSAAGHEQEELFERDARLITINPDIALRHDVSELRQLLGGGQIRQALELYRGHYLVDCDMGWARQRALELKSAVLDAGLACQRDAASWLERLEISSRCLEIEPTCQWACLATMEGLRRQGRFREALAALDALEAKLSQGLGSEVSTGLLRQRQLCRMEDTTTP